MRQPDDPRLEPSVVDTGPATPVRRKVRFLVLLNLPLAVWYFGWLLQPERMGHPVIFGMLVAAEVFNLAQAAGFWWTASHERKRPSAPPVPLDGASIDVLVPVYNEPLEVVEPTIAAAAGLRGAHVNVWLLDDRGRADLQELAARYGVGYIRREDNRGAKAGNINHALKLTTAPFVAVFDSDHVPDETFLERTLGYFSDPGVALVQTPQYYANAGRGVAAGAWAQQSLFFGTIARGKDGLGAMFCCGTNFVFRRTALEQAGGFPEKSLTEDFLLSIIVQENGWKTVYVPDVLAKGLGPEDMGSYVGQQLRWARGCLSTLARAVFSRLAWPVKLQYVLSAMFFLTGWTLLIYMSLPVIRIVAGAQPLAQATADQFILHFVPYYAAVLFTVAVAGKGSYTYSAFALLAASFWVHVVATVAALLRLPGRFVVTPKTGARGAQPGAVAPTLVAIGVLVGAAVYGAITKPGPATLNNVAFASLHILVLVSGAAPALRGARAEARPKRLPARKAA